MSAALRKIGDALAMTQFLRFLKIASPCPYFPWHSIERMKTFQKHILKNNLPAAADAKPWEIIDPDQ
ncbi:hypothetical protein [Salipiger sp. PrR002]|uniref:hypothetical protein n=1 Tax=Salipiger sp. PrR002 TaxID=2706489 RepID=UPI0013B8D90E|nr:hypothetical protein [Salipiger sp. PrR002]NDW02057.1 hypothetical protein [Salipiger sp. PrR002]NDW59105.1 hypothetical protein [Salipiger sp. PrR004]